MRSILYAVLIAFFLSGCSGVRLLGTHPMLDGSTKQFVEVTTSLEYGPAMRIIEGIRYDKSVDDDGIVTYVNPQLESRYSAGGTGIINSLVDSSIPVAISGVLAVKAAKALRPDRTVVTQTGGGASSISEGGAALAGAGASSDSNAKSRSDSNAKSLAGSSASTFQVQDQDQGQGQLQGQLQGQQQGQLQGQQQGQGQQQQQEPGDGGCQGNCDNGNGNED